MSLNISANVPFLHFFHASLPVGNAEHRLLLSRISKYNTLGFGLIVGLVILIFIHYVSSPWRKVPPGPKGIPLLGNVLDMKDKAWLFSPDLRKKYGDIVYLNALGQPIVFLNTQKVAADLLDRRASIYSDRPRLIVASEISSGGLSLGFTPYGNLWRRMRRAAHECLSRTAVQNFRNFHYVQAKEGIFLALDILANPGERNEHFCRASASMIMSVVYDLPTIRSLDDINLKNIDCHIERLAHSATSGAHLVELLPWMKHIPSRLAKWKREAEYWFSQDSALFERLVRTVHDDLDQGIDKFSLSAALIKDSARFGITERERAWLAGTMYAAGSETTASALQWWSLAMVAYPETQKRAQAELDAVVGRGRLPTIADLPYLPYIRAIVKETLRWRPNIPLGIPHRSTEDDWYEGMFIPKGTICFANVMQCNNDPDVYGADYMHFKPERHLDSDGKLAPGPPNTKDEGHVMYGFGRRICVGRHVANDSLFIDFATVLWALNLEAAKDASGKTIPLDIDSFVDVGLVSRPVPFNWTVSPRFPEAPFILAEQLELLEQ
ncbi:cytochrome P450 [Artomyces pyxidatus]|uniref:Cytochrome P450 n=1 Tax=Artomyces pyxidatus TaxID=48021 RepID=A0ACB8SV27_9AGAM|nr:cytochrome P450 [Artomyces pyxidatus]